MASVLDKISNALKLGKRSRDPQSPAADIGEPATKRPTAKKPLFEPWSQAALIRRLETYKALNWNSKPSNVDAVECACHGWINEGRDKLCCEHCGVKLLYPARPYEERAQAAAEFEPKLINKHAVDCPWRTTRCNDALLRFIAPAAPQMMHSFLERAEKIQDIDMLPDLEMATVSKLAQQLPRAFQAHILQPHSGSPSLSGCDRAGETCPLPQKLSYQEKARVLALLGWQPQVLPLEGSDATARTAASASSYGIQHLAPKPKHCTTTTSSATTAAGHQSYAKKKASMLSTVLECQHCHSRVGLWNIAGLQPTPLGRYMPSRASLPGTRLSTNGTGAASSSATHILQNAAVVTDSLAKTIAGGSFSALQSVTASSSRPFGTSSSEPVFGLSAVKGADASRDSAVNKRRPGSADENANPSGSANMGTPAEGPATKRARLITQGAATADVASQIFTKPAANNSSPLVHPVRSRISASGLGRSLDTFDPVFQHRSWCPWVYAGTGTGIGDYKSITAPKFDSGWVCTLKALDQLENPQVAVPEMATQAQQDDRVIETVEQPGTDAEASGKAQRLHQRILQKLRRSLP